MPFFTFMPMTRKDENSDFGIFRARKYEGWIPNTTEFFWEPPKEKVFSLGRCNRINESVFYGANHPSTALIESRAKKGELWFVGYFDIKSNAGITCFALGHSDHTIMKQAQNFKNDFYNGWNSQDKKKNKLVDDFIHRSFKRDFTANSLNYYETIGITQFFLNANGSKNLIHGITYPSVASGIRGGNFMFLPNVARERLVLKQIKLYRVDTLENNRIGVTELANSLFIEQRLVHWNYSLNSFKHMSFKQKE